MAEGSSPTLTEDNDSVSPTTTVSESNYCLEKRPLLKVIGEDTVAEGSCSSLTEDNDNVSSTTTVSESNYWLEKRHLLKVEDTMAEDHEEIIKSNSSVQTTRDSLNNTELVVNSMVHKVSEEQDLAIHAMELQEKYYNLLELIQHLARQYSNIELIKNKLRTILQIKFLYQSHTIAPYYRIIDTIKTVDEVFEFLVDNNFVGYLNFQLLEYFSSEIVCGETGSREVHDKLKEYKQIYVKFLKQSSFSKIIQVFDEYPYLNPKTVIGLPTIVVILTMEWKKQSKKNLEEWLPFLKENRALLQSMGYKCILITYAVFPIDLLNIMDFLNDPNNIKTLKDNGISIETPSHTLEIDKLLRENEKEEKLEDTTENENSSLTSTDNLLLQQLLAKVSSLEKQLIQEKEQRIADNSYWITQVTLLKASRLVDQEISTKRSEKPFQTAHDQKIRSDVFTANSTEKTIPDDDHKKHTQIQKPSLKKEKTKFDFKISSTELKASFDENSFETRTPRTNSTDSGLDTAGLSSCASSL